MLTARALWLAAALAAAGCTLRGGPQRPRPALAPAALAVSIPAVAEPRLAELDEVHPGRFTGVLEGDGQSVQFELRLDPATAGRPLVVLVPILAGGEELMEQVALRLQDRGFDAAFCRRAGGAMRQGQRGKDLDELFRITVLQHRLLLRWLRARDPAPSRLFAMGMSLGGMVATVLAAHEPGLDGVAICLSGGGVKELVGHSSEPRVQRWRTWRQTTDGIGDDGVRWDLEQFLTHEPLRYAPAVATDRVLMVEAAFDTVIPGRHQDLLWEALGRPARFTVPLGHYSAALAIDAIVAQVARHFDRWTGDTDAPAHAARR